jgi:hypothetical protein
MFLADLATATTSTRCWLTERGHVLGHQGDGAVSSQKPGSVLHDRGPFADASAGESGEPAQRVRYVIALSRRRVLQSIRRRQSGFMQLNDGVAQRRDDLGPVENSDEDAACCEVGGATRRRLRSTYA